MQMRREQIRPAVVGEDGEADPLFSNRVFAGAALLAQTQCATAAGVKGPKNNTAPLAAGGTPVRNRGKQRMSAL